LAAGYTIFRADDDSPSFPRRIELAPPGKPPAALAIEYAIWWDWDIGHLYELEHVWVFVDDQGRVARAEASWHGGFHDMTWNAAVPLEGDRLVGLSEPGKHAFAPHADWYAERWRDQRPRKLPGRRAGTGGVWVTPLFREQLGPLRTPFANSLVHTYLERRAFDPAWGFARRFPVTAELLVPWPALQAWIPGRVAWWVARLAEEIPPEALRFLRIGHRGASGHAPDNTLAAFRKAADLDADMVELDVQVSSDGALVVIHDLVVEHCTDGHGAVGDLTLAQLKALTVRDPRNAITGERIPTFEEAIACCQELGLGMYVELKAGAAVPQVTAAIRAHELWRSAIVGSFRPDWVAGVRLLEPDIVTSVLFGAPNVDPVKLAQAVGASYVHPCWEALTPQPHTLLTREWVQRVRHAGLGIVIWHEERPAEIAALRKMGVDAICSDLPELLT